MKQRTANLILRVGLGSALVLFSSAAVYYFVGVRYWKLSQDDALISVLNGIGIVLAWISFWPWVATFMYNNIRRSGIYSQKTLENNALYHLSIDERRK